MERPTFEAMLEAAIGVERDGSEYTVAEGYGLSVYIGKPGQAMEVSEVVGLRLDAAFCEATSGSAFGRRVALADAAPVSARR
jgi:hypothetical protein